MDKVAKPRTPSATRHSPAEKPVSLKPLAFEEAVRNLLKVRPKTKGTRGGKEIKPQEGLCQSED